MQNSDINYKAIFTDIIEIRFPDKKSDFTNLLQNFWFKQRQSKTPLIWEIRYFTDIRLPEKTQTQ